MGLTKWLACAAFAATQSLSAAPSAELLDLAARVHYGFYLGDARAIETAQAALARLPDSPEAQYYRDFAALRRAQLGAATKESADALAECAARRVADDVDKTVAAETWVLVAACAFARGDERRREQALRFARERDDDNPRIALVAAWAAERAAGADAGRRAALAELLATTVAAFDAWTPTIDDPDWGHAEALTAFAKNALERGETRTARDLIERALLLAPEYAVAVELRGSLQGARRSDRSL
jgi:hypothetical protein